MRAPKWVYLPRDIVSFKSKPSRHRRAISSILHCRRSTFSASTTSNECVVTEIPKRVPLPSLRPANIMTDPTSPVPILDCLEGSSSRPFPSISFVPSPPPAHPLENATLNVNALEGSIRDHLETATEHLKSSRLVAMPTETVYGLAAATRDPLAVRRVYELKGRPSDNPLIVHVSSLEMLKRLVPEDYQLSPLYIELITTFWPGPLTLLFPARNPTAPPPAPQTVAIRFPAHELARALIAYSDEPLSAPSANSSGRPSPTRAVHVWNDLGTKHLRGEGPTANSVLGCILDGGNCDVGLESTVVDAHEWNGKTGVDDVLKVLRPGGVSVEALEQVVNRVDKEFGTRTRVWVYGRDPPLNESALPDQSQSTGFKRADGASHKPKDTSGAPSTVLSTPEEAAQSEIHSPRPVSHAASLVQDIVSNPSTPGMKYKHYSPSVPVFLLFPSSVFKSIPPRFASEAERQATQPLSVEDVSSTIRSIVNPVNPDVVCLGAMVISESPLSHSLNSTVKKVDLGPTPASAAQRLFDGLLELEGRSPAVNSVEPLQGTSSADQSEHSQRGVDAILVEACPEDGIGLAVMERINKAVGGAGSSGLTAHSNGTASTAIVRKRFLVRCEAPIL